MTVEFVLFLSFQFVVAVVLYAFALFNRQKSYQVLFSLLSSFVFTSLAIATADYTILMLVFFGIVCFQIVTLIVIRKGGFDE